MKFKRITGLLFAIVMLACIFSGCTRERASDSSATPDGAATAEPSPTDGTADADPTETAGSDAAAQDIDLDAAAAAFSADTLIMTVDGSPVYWDEFFYWFTVNLSYVESSYYITDWSEVIDGETWAEYALSETVDTARLYRAVEKKSAEMGIALTAEDEEYLQYYWDSAVEQFGGEEEFLQYLSDNYMTAELYNYMNEVATLYYAMMDELYGSEGEKLTDEETRAYAEDIGYMQAKHILLLTSDDAGTEMSDEEKADLYSQMEGFLSQLGAASGDEVEAVFDSIMNAYSEDGGLAAFPDGYLFVEGEMVTEFEEAAMALEPYEYSGIVETDYGYHVILRLPIDPDAIPNYYYTYYGYTYTLRYYAAADTFDSLMYGWSQESTAEYAEAYEGFDVNALFGF